MTTTLAEVKAEERRRQVASVSSGNPIWIAMCAQCRHRREYDNRPDRDSEAGRHNEATGHPVLLVRHEEE